MADTSIEWTQRPGTIGAVWNSTTGCDKISAGCDNCYALGMARRLKAMGQAKYQNDGHPVTSGPGFALTIHPDELSTPLRWRKPRTVFVNSMSDLFHARVSREFLARFWAVMAATPQHTYQILTKRPERMAKILNDACTCGAGHRPGVHFKSAMSWATTSHSPTHVPGLDPKMGRFSWLSYDEMMPLPNVWLGTSIELDKHAGRADALRDTPAAVRFISAEPLLGPLPSLDLTGIDWLIIGGESGPGSRPMDLAWVEELIGKARGAGTAVFVKQLGKVWAGSGKGGDWSTWPEHLRIREYPAERVAVTA
jgi:protein gp37